MGVNIWRQKHGALASLADVVQHFTGWITVVLRARGARARDGRFLVGDVSNGFGIVQKGLEILSLLRNRWLNLVILLVGYKISGVLEIEIGVVQKVEKLTMAGVGHEIVVIVNRIEIEGSQVLGDGESHSKCIFVGGFFSLNDKK